MKPVIGITARIEKDQNYSLAPIYAKAILQSGGLPLIVPIVDNEDVPYLSERLDGLIVIGSFAITKHLVNNHSVIRHAIYRFHGNDVK